MSPTIDEKSPDRFSWKSGKNDLFVSACHISGPFAAEQSDTAKSSGLTAALSDAQNSV
jgi:hypothetical protein